MSHNKHISILDQPKGLYFLFFAELWERFSFYGMRALLVLYMVNEFKFTDSRAYGIAAAYAALVYTMPILGGYLADHFLGNRRAIIAGGVIIAFGHICLTFESMTAFYYGLGLVIIGTGLFKANISAMLGELYKDGDPRRDAGFTIFYMGINAGALIAPLICGYLAHEYSWHHGFGAAAIGMLLGLIVFLWGTRHFGDAGKAPNAKILKQKILSLCTKEQLIYALCLSILPLFAYLINQDHIFDILIKIIGVLVVLYVLYLSFVEYPKAKGALITLLVLMVFQATFYAIFQQIFSSLTLFADRVMDRHVLGMHLEASQFFFLDPVFIVLFAIPLSALWVYLGKKHLDPSPALKFVFGLTLTGVAFFIIDIGIERTTYGGLTSGYYLIGAYGFLALAELCISPIGLSLVTKITPKPILSMMMGIWFLSIAFAENIAGFLAKLSAIETPDGEEIDRIGALAIYKDAFTDMMYVAFVAAFILLFISPLMRPVFKRLKEKQDDFVDHEL